MTTEKRRATEGFSSKNLELERRGWTETREAKIRDLQQPKLGMGVLFPAGGKTKRQDRVTKKEKAGAKSSPPL